MTTLQFSEKDFLDAAGLEEDFTNTSNKAFEPGAESYLKEFYSDALQNEFLDYSLENLIILARDFWMFGNRRLPGKFILEVTESPTPVDEDRPDTAVKIVTDNMAFLVDSVVAAVSHFGINVHGLFHPIVRGNRNNEGRWLPEVEDEDAIEESMILLMVPPQNRAIRQALEVELREVLSDVHLINQDFLSLVASLKDSATELNENHGDVESDVADEAVAFLNWLADGNFVLFGVRHYDYSKSLIEGSPTPDYVNPYVIREKSLGLLKDPNVYVLRQSSEPSVIESNVSSYIKHQPPVLVAKSNLSSRVHRRVRMDYISIKHYSNDGTVNGETRFIGLFTSTAYSRSPQYVPLIRRKVERVLQSVDMIAGSHNYKRLEHVLATYPRDELFQIGHKDLKRISVGIAHAFDRPRTRLFIRRDPYNRFVSALVYVPRENYNTRIREKIGSHLKLAFNGRVSAFYPQYDDSSLARVHFIIGLDPDTGLKPDQYELETEISAIAQPWFSGIALQSDQETGEDKVDDIYAYQDAFTLAYQEKFTPEQSLRDIKIIQTMSNAKDIAVDVYDSSKLENRLFKGKIYHWSYCLEPSNMIPIFTNFGIEVIQETAYPVNRPDGATVWVHDFSFRLKRHTQHLTTFNNIFANGFIATWKGQNEDDSFNRLILPQSAPWRHIAFIRLLSRYRRQSGMDPSEVTQVEALDRYQDISGKLIGLIKAKFDPMAYTSMEERSLIVSELEQQIETGLNGVESLEHDRVLRRIFESLKAALRTNFYQTDDKDAVKAHISVKFDSRSIENLPAPKPYREIFVSSPIVEGVHLRFGPVARGGLRWSDRRDDFRTEVLGLVKAQQVKNAVIVPVGSKGGFYPKQLPEDGNREDIRDAGIAAYKTFICGLLDITDNYKGESTVAPANTICWDAPDPYLVVAADKGTATFSDIANGISKEYGFWLDDAFASGGSAGYDHKAMGITARGGWEAVKRHFRELGKDIQTEDFNVIGVGDMSGDVFGNGMLLSKHICLKAAFNHLHIFVDPNPDSHTSFVERERMFNLPRSTWDDYNKALISNGGGVFARSAKSIDLSDEIKTLTGLTKDKVTPSELIHALLKAKTELLWFGGIGTYVKGSDETHMDVGDKANDSLRVNASDISTKVIGEGANLGLTQAARIEFARKGGSVNTDAIDNSAGVDSSDNEVNIKILLRGAIENGDLKEGDRNALLAHMTDDVAELVLQHNYDQTGVLSLAEMRSRIDHNAYERFMRTLEKRELLDRAVEGLPSTEAMDALKSDAAGLTRPEIATLIAYSKNVLFDDLIETDTADDPFMSAYLVNYFPQALHKYKHAMQNHRLRREIITSRLINRIVDVGGATFVMRIQEQTQGSVAAIAKAFMVAFEALDIQNLREQIANLDNKVQAKSQLELHNEIVRVMLRVITWMVRRGEEGDISSRIEKRSALSKYVDSEWLKLLSPYDRRRADSRIRKYIKSGISEDLATDVALLRSRASGFDVVELSQHTGWSLSEAAELFYDIGGRFKIDRSRAAILAYSSDSHWERLALRQLVEDFFKTQFSFAKDAAKHHIAQGGQSSDLTASIIKKWVADKMPRIESFEDTFTAMTQSGGWNLSKFTLINAQLNDLLSDL